MGLVSPEGFVNANVAATACVITRGSEYYLKDGTNFMPQTRLTLRQKGDCLHSVGSLPIQGDIEARRNSTMVQ